MMISFSLDPGEQGRFRETAASARPPVGHTLGSTLGRTLVRINLRYARNELG